MAGYARGSHTIHDINYHFIWLTKYRYAVLTEKIAERLWELLIPECASRGITIVGGSVGKEHVHMLLSCPTHLVPTKIVQYLKGRSSILIQDEFPELKKRYWGQYLWERGYFCATAETVTQKMIKEYIEHQFEYGSKDDFQP